MAYNVLIVDDSETTRSIIAKALRHAEVELGELLFAGDGLEALTLLRDNWVDIVFADLNMPRLSGVELVERMAESDLLASVPVVIVSTEGRQERIDALLARGVAAYLRKPFAPEQVVRIADELLGVEKLEVEDRRLEEAFFGAIEGFAMLVAEPLDGDPEAPDRALESRMSIIGARAEAEVAIVTSERGGIAIAQAALGESEDGSAQDALRELLNVLVGHLVNSMSGGPFELQLPESRAVAGAEAWAGVRAMDQRVAFDLEGDPVVIGLTIKDRW